MKKKIEWWLVDGEGRGMYHTDRRIDARNERKWYNDNIFDAGDTVYPITIKRKEWLLVSDKVVR